MSPPASITRVRYPASPNSPAQYLWNSEAPLREYTVEPGARRDTTRRCRTDPADDRRQRRRFFRYLSALWARDLPVCASHDRQSTSGRGDRAGNVSPAHSQSPGLQSRQGSAVVLASWNRAQPDSKNSLAPRAKRALSKVSVWKFRLPAICPVTSLARKTSKPCAPPSRRYPPPIAK